MVGNLAVGLTVQDNILFILFMDSLKGNWANFNKCELTRENIISKQGSQPLLPTMIITNCIKNCYKFIKTRPVVGIADQSLNKRVSRPKEKIKVFQERFLKCAYLFKCITR